MRKLAAALGVALACLAAAAHAQNYSPAAKQVLARAQAASGGRGWLYLRGVHETGKLGTTPYQSWTDTLRYGVRIETREAAGLRIHAYNGAPWPARGRRRSSARTATSSPAVFRPTAPTSGCAKRMAGASMF